MTLLFIFGFALFFHIFMISSQDKEGYEKLHEPPETASFFSAKQSREGVVKTLILSQGEERKLGILKARSSQLVYEKEKGKTGLVEDMEDAELIYQEELLPEKKQLVMKLNAKSAKYDYQREKLIAKDAILTRYEAPGHQFPEELKDPYFEGTAEQAALEFKKNPYMKAYKLKASQSPASFFVDEASFENGMIHFLGGLQYEHPMGSIDAKSGTAQFNKGVLNHLPDEVVMKEGVFVRLKEGSTIWSPYCKLDSDHWTGFFHGLEGDKVVLEKGSQSLSLKSLKMILQFFPPGNKIDHLTADGEVEISLGSDFLLKGKRVIFDTFTPEGKFTKALLTGEEGKTECRLVKDKEAEIYASEIALDLTKEIAVLKAAHGTIQTNTMPMKFSAGSVTIQKEEGLMILDPPLVIEWGGTLQSTGQAKILQAQNKGKRTLSFLDCQGPSTLKMKDEKGILHTLKTHGAITINPESKTTVITSEGKQIHFSDLYGDIFADNAQIHYEEIEGKLKPLKLHLKGNVRLQNVDTGFERYALADQADYDVSKGEVTLKSKRPSRVLFYDLANKVQASAPALTLKRNPETNKDEIKGTGNVRFLFAEEEFNELKKRFSLGPN